MKRTVLAIDGSKAMRFLLQTVLGDDYNVITASDGASALYWLSKSNTPDLIVIDPQLPDGENWEMIEFLSESGLYGNIPTIVLSALDKSEVQFKCSEFGIQYFFLKPFNPIDFSKQVDALLKGISVTNKKLKAV